MARNEPNEHVRLWREAVEAKFFGSRKYRKLETTEDFDRILWDYEVRFVPVIFPPDVRSGSRLRSEVLRYVVRMG